MKNLCVVFFLLLVLATSCASKKEKNEVVEVPAMDESSEQLVADEKDAPNLGSETIKPDATKIPIKKQDTYIVKKGDTLMWIAAQIYGDYGRWRELVAKNPDINIEILSAGTVLKFDPPKKKFVMNKSGSPYLIKEGDSLSIISSKLYQTTDRWRELYENNKPIIKDPNLIFAGFTIYYAPLKTYEISKAK